MKWLYGYVQHCQHAAVVGSWPNKLVREFSHTGDNLGGAFVLVELQGEYFHTPSHHDSNMLNLGSPP